MGETMFYWIMGTFLVIQFTVMQFLKFRIKKKGKRYIKKLIRSYTFGGLLAGLLASICLQTNIWTSLLIIIISGLYFYINLFFIYRTRKSLGIKDEEE